MPKFSIVVRPYKCSARPNAKWVLNVWYPTGKRQRRYFETKEAALAEQAVKKVEVEKLGLRALEISDRLRMEALDAQERLAGYLVGVFSSWFSFIMASSSDRFYLHITAVPQEFCLERCPFGNLTFVDLPPLIGDRSGHGHVTLTYRYFRNQPLFVIGAEGDTLLDGLTADECDEAIRWISGPPGRRLNWPVPRNRVRFCCCRLIRR